MRAESLGRQSGAHLKVTKTRNKNAPATDEQGTTRAGGCESIREIVEQIEANFLEADMTPSAGDLLRLLELRGELTAEETEHIKVRWVEEWKEEDSEE
jgi:hypothetical protein